MSDVDCPTCGLETCESCGGCSDCLDGIHPERCAMWHGEAADAEYIWGDAA